MPVAGPGILPSLVTAGNNAWSYVKGQCTAFAAQMAPWIPPGLGNAADWLHNAQLKGLPTTSVPTVGSVVVYGRGGNYDHANGHVAVVTAVAADLKSFTVAEQNYGCAGCVHYGRVSSLSGVQGFILPTGSSGGTSILGVTTNAATAGLNLNPLDAVGAGFAALGKDLARIAWVFVGLLIVLLGVALLVVPEVVKKSPVPVPLP